MINGRPHVYEHIKVNEIKTQLRHLTKEEYVTNFNINDTRASQWDRFYQNNNALLAYLDHFGYFNAEE